MSQKAIVEIMKEIDSEIAYHKKLHESDSYSERKIGFTGLKLLLKLRKKCTSIIKKHYDRSKSKIKRIRDRKRNEGTQEKSE